MKDKEVQNWQYEKAFERYQIISQLVDPELDDAKKISLRKKISVENDVSEKTLRRWEAAYFKSGFDGLKPAPKSGYQTKKLPKNYPELIKEAIQLRREVNERSVEQIIYILEAEGKAPPGVLRRSTLQKHLFEAGMGEQHLRMYKQDQNRNAARRFCKPHRNMLVQADIKYGTGVLVTANGKKVTAYLSTLLDDHSRFPLWSEWYEDQTEYCVEDVFHKAVLKCGKFDKSYCDNGSQYISRQLKMSCAMLGIKITHAPVRSGKSKGKVEKFHQVVDCFVREVKLKKVMDISELNRWWRIFLEEYYEKKPHEGIAEYYKSKGIEVPECGISPEQEWNRDSRPLVFLDTKVVAEAFMHHEYRNVDKGGLISFKGNKYEVGSHLIAQKVMIAFDPFDHKTITVYPKDDKPFSASPVSIGEYCKKSIPVPAAVAETPATSRFLDALEKKHEESQKRLADAISYGSYRKEKSK